MEKLPQIPEILSSTFMFSHIKKTIPFPKRKTIIRGGLFYLQRL